MPIPTTRAELTRLVTASFERLVQELDRSDPQIAGLPCVEDWSVKGLLAVRAWWTERVGDWIDAGRRGESPATPAPGYRWTETPRLNADLVRRARAESYAAVRARLERGCERVLAAIAALDDRELLLPGAFAWAGKWPLSRWISINTARQYTTATALIRRAVRRAPRPAARRRFSAAVVTAIRDGRILGLRAGVRPHRFIGVWAVVVEGRVFVRSWSRKPDGWHSAFLAEPRGTIQVDRLGGRRIAVRAVRTRSERLKDAVSRAYREKYPTPASRRYVRDMARPGSRSTTTELVPR
jgi:hypothetical protein